MTNVRHLRPPPDEFDWGAPLATTDSGRFTISPSITPEHYILDDTEDCGSHEFDREELLDLAHALQRVYGMHIPPYKEGE